jgi:hypothetical protein
MKNLFVILFVFIIHYSLLTIHCEAQWGADLRLTSNDSISRTSDNNAYCVATNGNLVHVLWYDKRDGNYEIYYKRSTDGGLNWGTDFRLTNNIGDSWYPSVAVYGSVVHVVWFDNRDGNDEIYFKRSLDGGSTWGTDIRLTYNSSASWFPSVSVSGQAVHVVWYDFRDGNREIYYMRSLNGGVTWGTETRLTNNPSFSYNTSISVYGQFVHVVWQDNRDGNDEIYYMRSTNNGVNWSNNTRLTNSPNLSGFPAIAVSGNIVHIVWQDKRNFSNGEIFYKNSIDGGVSWGTDMLLSNSGGSATYDPTISAIGPGYVHVVWWDARAGNYEIYYKGSTNGGISWGADSRLTNNPAASENPFVSVAPQAVHVVWTDFRNGNYEIYYKRNFIGGSPPGIPILVSPLNNSINQSLTPSLEWGQVANSLSYRVQVSTDSMFITIVYDVNLSLTQINVPSGLLTNNTKYYWQVQASNEYGAGQWSALWNFKTLSVGITKIGNEIPTAFTLYQNYPNPFNPTTKIKFDIPQKTVIARSGATWQSPVVTLKVFDILGKEIATLANEQLQPGTYEVTFNGSSLPSGIYFYKLIAGDFVETKKLVLLK